jgi:hypothetical protein
MLLASHDDPSAAADYLLCDIEQDLEAMGLLPPEALSHFRDRAADVAARLRDMADKSPREHSTCESQAHLNSAGPGGKAPLPASTRPSTKATRKPGSTPSASSATATGQEALSFPPASGGSPAISTPKPANSRRPKNAAPKSMASSSTPGEFGHG